MLVKCSSLTSHLMILLLLCVTGCAVGQEGSQDIQRFQQDRFAIGIWVDPPADERMDERYAEIAEANFTLVFGGFGATNRETIAQQVELCEKYGLDALVTPATVSEDDDELVDGPACWGHMFQDEPGAGAFADLAIRVQAYRETNPGQLAYINLYPNYASPAQWGVDNYREYLDRFVQEVDPDVLSMDHYPLMTPDVDRREAYCQNLAIMREVSLAQGIPFWNFFNTMPFANHYDPTEAQLRWQIYTSLAYGAKGVLYFCYYTPNGWEFRKGGAIITREDRRTRHYYQAQRINGAVKNLGPTLMQLTSTDVLRIRPDDDPETILAGSLIAELTPGDYLIGVFRHADGRRAVLLNNYSFAYTAWPTVGFDCELGELIEIDPETGNEMPVIDDSPDMEGLQISLDAGQGRLFLLP